VHDPAGEASADRRAWQLATESIVVKIRWFGIVMGYILVQTRQASLYDPTAVRAILALGAGYAALDTFFHRRGQVFLLGRPLFVSSMEATFIGLLCYFDTGLDSPFRWFYLLSSICCAIRYRPLVAWLTLLLHGASLALLVAVLSPERRVSAWTSVPLTFVVLAWATWAVAALANLLKATGRRLEAANSALERHGAELEERIAEHVADLRASQARIIHQEKMAAFGLLSAGISHEVGNPLAAVSSLVQMLRRRRPEPYTDAKLEQAERQLSRISRIIRELVDFSRPASAHKTRFRLSEAIDDALGIAKYYHRTKERSIHNELADDLPLVEASRDHLAQIVLNLILNAIDATTRQGRIVLRANLDASGEYIMLEVVDNGCGIELSDQPRVFEPYFTTKTRGTGLGLFISRQMAEAMEGRLTFASEPGVGTTFVLSLPVPAEVRLGLACETARPGT
jgi:signal transduction histidine kinase